jgi:polyhydroxybutyrate depolymerase
MKKTIILFIIFIVLFFFGRSYAGKILKLITGGKPAAPEDSLLKKQTLVYKGKKRGYLLYIPSTYSGDTRVPLVLVFHGGGGNGKGIALRSGMHRLSEQHGFIVAYPYGASRTVLGKNLSWNAGTDPPQGYSEKNNIDDVGFIRELVKKMKSEFRIDDNSIHASGLSKGGMFCYRLACEMSETFASIAVVAATMTIEPCRPARSVPLLIIHGSEDQNVPLHGGTGRYSAKKANYPTVQKGIDTWIGFNKCSNEVEERKAAKDTSCTIYKGCSGNAEIVFCLVEGGGHGWPGAQPTKRQKRHDVYISPYFDASKEMWEFFKEHPIQ